MQPSGVSLDYNSALQACTRGEIWALRNIFESEGPLLYAMVLRIVRDERAAERTLKAALIQVFNEAGRFDSRLGSARGWVYSVVRQNAIAARRRQDLESSLRPAPALPVPSTAAVSPLPDPVALAFYEGYTRTQIAGLCHAPLAAVVGGIRNALVQLKDAPA